MNTWVGALVGAVPPLMGWAAAAGGLSLGAAALGAVLYWWQMPHFMALAWMCKADYGAGGYRMLSLVDPTGRRTAACALRNCVYLMPLGILAVCLGVTTDAFAFENAIISGGMAATAAAFYQVRRCSGHWAGLVYGSLTGYGSRALPCMRPDTKPQVAQAQATLSRHHCRM